MSARFTCVGSGTSSRGGFVLVSVLWILAILTVVSLGFARRAMLERQMAWYALDREQAQQMARGAAERALFELANKDALDAFNYQTGYTSTGQRWTQRVDMFKEFPYFQEAKNGLAGDSCSYVIEDCERRISLNGSPRKVLTELEALSEDTIQEILERRRSDSRGYQAQQFRSIEELRALQEFSEDEWYGSGDEAGLRDLLTVWGDTNRGFINVNTASADVLSKLPGIDPEVVEAIIAYRSGPDTVLNTADDRAFVSTQEVNLRLNLSAEKLAPIRIYCKIWSQYFTIKSHATRRGGKIAAFCTVVVQLDGATPSILEWREQAHGA